MLIEMRAATLIAAMVWGLSSVASAQSGAPGEPKARSNVAPKLAAITPASADALAQVLAGGGVAISNASLKGAPEAAGMFSGAAASIGIDTGVVLSTGKVVDTVGPNTDEDRSTDFERTGNGALDSLVAPYRTHDAVILEFDLLTAEPTIGIRFVFASEEYDEYVDSPFNDMAAIFVNGVNCANVNGRPVAVNSINATLNADLFVDNAARTRDVAMNGLTIPLECVAAVTPNVPNRIRIAVADTADGGLDTAVFLAARGVRAPASGPPTNGYVAKAVEYFNPGFNHYFVTADPNEVAKLDDGVFDGWFRTGLGFNVFNSGTPGTAPVCRFFSTAFGSKSSHFYTPNAAECAGLKSSSNWQLEGEVFNMGEPAGTDGACATGTRPLYRMYNDGEGGAPNHRYTTELRIRDLMVANGWTPEGAGIGVIGCVPR